MANWYATREQLKKAAEIDGVVRNPMVDRNLEGASRFIEQLTRRYFIPRTQTRLYRWPNRMGVGRVLWLDQDLLSLTTLQTKAQDSSPTTIVAADFFLEPNNPGADGGTRYNRIEIDISSSAAFESGDTPQRSISVLGSWGFTDATVTAGTINDSGGISASDLTLIIADASLVDVGNTLLIESEQIFVSERANAQVGSEQLDAALTATQNQVAVTVDSGANFNAGEVIQVDSEKMLIVSISSNVLTVIRAYDGSVLAAHNDDTAVHAFRTLTIERAVNGTTAATHADATAITKYVPPVDLRNWCLAIALVTGHQEQAGWGRTVGGGEAAVEFKSLDLGSLTTKMTKLYQRAREATI